jgi:TIR domain
MRKARRARWDLFISHASEDKKDFVQPLASALDALGVRVWYDASTLKLGDSLSRSIDQGLAKSDYGLVVLSPAFLSKQWPEYEIRGLTARELSGGKVILPI